MKKRNKKKSNIFNRKNKYRLINAFISPLLYWVIRTYSFTWRYEMKNERPWLELREEGGVVLFACWHQQFFPAIDKFRRYNAYRPCLLISPSRDGDIIARVAKKCGWSPVRGSSSRDSIKGLKGMIDQLKQKRLGAHVVDGPKGPMGIIKPGLVQLARATKAVIVPFYISADRAWFFQSWDRFMLPKPFAKVVIEYGDMIRISEDSQMQQMETERIADIMLPKLHHRL